MHADCCLRSDAMTNSGLQVGAAGPGGRLPCQVYARRRGPKGSRGGDCGNQRRRRRGRRGRAIRRAFTSRAERPRQPGQGRRRGCAPAVHPGTAKLTGGGVSRHSDPHASRDMPYLLSMLIGCCLLPMLIGCCLLPMLIGCCLLPMLIGYCLLLACHAIRLLCPIWGFRDTTRFCVCTTQPARPRWTPRPTCSTTATPGWQCHQRHERHLGRPTPTPNAARSTSPPPSPRQPCQRPRRSRFATRLGSLHSYAGPVGGRREAVRRSRQPAGNANGCPPAAVTVTVMRFTNGSSCLCPPGK